MFQDLSCKNEVKDAKANKSAAKAPQGYSTPKLVELGQAYTLVQGTDLYKDFQEGNRSFRN